MADQYAVISRRHETHHLAHEELSRMWRGTDDVHTARGEVDDKHRVVGHQAAPRPDFRGEEICGRDRAPMGAQKRLPRGRALRDRGQARRFQDPPNR